jgi:hypothetical protein
MHYPEIPEKEDGKIHLVVRKKKKPSCTRRRRKDPISGKAITLSIYDWNSANIIEIVRKLERKRETIKTVG